MKEFGYYDVALYGADGFDKMIEEQKPDCVIVTSIDRTHLFGEPYEGGHGGGDPVLLNDIFGTPEPNPLNRAASHIDGVMSILTGIAANKSIETGMLVDVDKLVEF